MHIKLSVLFLIFYTALHVTANARRRVFSEEDDIRQVLMRPATCAGQLFNLIHLERERKSEIEECMVSKFIDAVEHLTNSRRTSERKLIRNERRLNRILRRECLDECTWQAFGLIPTEETEIPSQDGIKPFSELLPEKARESVKTGLEACLSVTSYRQSTIDHFFRVRRACSKNRGLVECMQGAVMQACRGRGRNSIIKTTTTSTLEPTTTKDEETETISSTTTEISRARNASRHNQNKNVGEEVEPNDDDDDESTARP